MRAVVEASAPLVAAVRAKNDVVRIIVAWRRPATRAGTPHVVGEVQGIKLDADLAAAYASWRPCTPLIHLYTYIHLNFKPSLVKILVGYF